MRLNNTSQLAAFTKRDDLEFFLAEICGADYQHRPELSPTKDILDAYKKKTLPWEQYEAKFIDLLTQRAVEDSLPKQLFEVPAVLLCSEPTADRCHRRIVAEYLAERWPDVSIVHL